MNKSPVKHYVMPLTSIIGNDKDTIDYITYSLKKRGYVFVRLPPKLVEQIDEATNIMEQFFSNSEQYKKRFFKEPIFGYFGVNHKESFRVLTGSRINEQTYPMNFNKVKELIDYVDKLMYSTAIKLAPTLFPNLSENAKRLDIPFFNGKDWWGMFDTARYFNDGRNVNCAEHFDPGLLSFSFRSTEEGLQLKDEHGKWIKVPADKTLAVLWTGKAATDINPEIKPGVHRVMCNTFRKQRLSMWHEICTAAQEHKELIKKKDDVAFKFESKTGIPMSKSGI